MRISNAVIKSIVRLIENQEHEATLEEYERQFRGEPLKAKLMSLEMLINLLPENIKTRWIGHTDLTVWCKNQLATPPTKRPYYTVNDDLVALVTLIAQECKTIEELKRKIGLKKWQDVPE